MTMVFFCRLLLPIINSMGNVDRLARLKAVGIMTISVVGIFTMVYYDSIVEQPYYEDEKEGNKCRHTVIATNIQLLKKDVLGATAIVNRSILSGLSKVKRLEKRGKRTIGPFYPENDVANFYHKVGCE